MSTKPQTKPAARPSAKATKCWANVYPETMCIHFSDRSASSSLTTDGRTVPAYLITQEQVKECVEKMADALSSGVAKNDSNDTWRAPGLRYLFINQARAALRALGIRGGKR